MSCKRCGMEPSVFKYFSRDDITLFHPPDHFQGLRLGVPDWLRLPTVVASQPSLRRSGEVTSRHRANAITQLSVTGRELRLFSV